MREFVATFTAKKSIMEGRYGRRRFLHGEDEGERHRRRARRWHIPLLLFDIFLHGMEKRILH